MPLNDEEIQRIESLPEGVWPSPWIRAFYGLDPDQPLPSLLQAWENRTGKTIKTNGGQVNRFLLEGALQAEDHLTLKWAAAEVGLEENSLREALLSLVKGKLLSTSVWDEPSGLVPKRLANQLHRYLPRGSQRVFGDRESHSRWLREELRVLDDRLDLRSLYCSMSDGDDDQGRHPARAFDVVTFRPVCPRHEVWIDFRKPAHLRPDVCSIRTAEEAGNLLRDHVFPSHRDRLATAPAA